jgi:glycine/D-amino acid oxidase-like deaminating enzyme
VTGRAEVAAMPTSAATQQAPAPVRFGVYWRETEEVSHGSQLHGDRQADVCVIGGGYTGMWTAYYLKKARPDIQVTILEADYAGSGASGHGDGFITPTIGHNLAALIRAYGSDRAKIAYTVVNRSILEIQRFTRTYQIDAQIEPTGYLNVATSNRQLHTLDRDLRLMERLGAQRLPPVLGHAAIREYVDSPALLGGFKIGGAMVNPHRLVRGLSRVVRELGVDLYERSAALDVSATPDRYRIRTAGGTVAAGQVIYATNAYQHRFPALRSMVRPFWSYAVVTEPLTPEQLALVRWPGREGFVESRNLIAFARLTAQNRLLVGGGPVPYFYGRDMRPDHMRDKRPMRLLTGLLARYFPAWRDIRITHAYGGCLDMTPDFVPHVGRLPTGELYAHGYCGNGVALSNTVGKVLRDLVLGTDSAYTDLLFVGSQQRRYRSEPVAWLQSKSHNIRMGMQDRLPPLTRRTPALQPAKDPFPRDTDMPR